MKESDVQKAVLDLLAAHRILAFRMNTGVARYQDKGKDSFVKYGQTGMADVIAFPEFMHCPCRVGRSEPMRPGEVGPACACMGGPTLPHVLWIECKAPDKKQKPEQVSFQKIVEDNHHSYIVVDNPDVLIRWFKEHGIR